MELTRAELVVIIRELESCPDYGPTHKYVLSALKKLQQAWLESLANAPKEALTDFKSGLGEDPIFRFIEALEPRLGLHAPVPESPMATALQDAFRAATNQGSFPMPLVDAAKAEGKAVGVAFLDVTPKEEPEGPCPHGRAHWSECVECVMAQEG